MYRIYILQDDAPLTLGYASTAGVAKKMIARLEEAGMDAMSQPIGDDVLVINGETIYFD